MLNIRLTALRKMKGITQEELAEQLHVVRQTISKWEKGLSVPDATMVIRLSQIFEVPVSTVLGEEFIANDEMSQKEVAEQLAGINHQLAIKNRRWNKFWKIFGMIILIVVVFNIVMLVVSMVSFKMFSNEPSVTMVTTTNQVVME